MAVTYVSSSTVGGSGTLITINRPAGIAVGDFMLAAVAFRGQVVNITPPVGWTFLRRDDETTHHSLVTYYRFYAAGDPTSWTWTLAVSGRHAAGISAYNDVSSSFPVDGLNGQTNSTASTTISGPSVTTSLDNQLLIAIAVSEASGQIITPPVGYTSRFTADAGGSANAGCTTNLSDKFFTPAGTTGPISATQVTSRDSTMQHLSLNKKGVPVIAVMSANATALSSQNARVTNVFQSKQITCTAAASQNSQVNNIASAEPLNCTAETQGLEALVDNIFQVADAAATANVSANSSVNNILQEESAQGSATCAAVSLVNNIFQPQNITSSALSSSSAAINYVAGAAVATVVESPLSAAVIYASSGSFIAGAQTYFYPIVVYALESSLIGAAYLDLYANAIYAGKMYVQGNSSTSLTASNIYSSGSTVTGLSQAILSAAAIYAATSSKVLGQGEAYLRTGLDPTRGTSSAKLVQSNQIDVSIIRIR